MFCLISWNHLNLKFMVFFGASFLVGLQSAFYTYYLAELPKVLGYSVAWTWILDSHHGPIIGFLRGVVIPLIFPKVPQSSRPESLGFPSCPGNPWTLKNPTNQICGTFGVCNQTRAIQPRQSKELLVTATIPSGNHDSAEGKSSQTSCTRRVLKVLGLCGES